MARPAVRHVWAFLLALVITKSPLLSLEIDDVVGAKVPYELNEENPPRNFSQELSQNHLQTPQNQNQNEGIASAITLSKSIYPTLVNLLNLKNEYENKKEIVPTNTNFQQGTYEPTSASTDASLTGPLDRYIYIQPATPPLFIQDESHHVVQDTPLDSLVHDGAAGDSGSVTTILQNPVTVNPIKQPTTAKSGFEIQDTPRFLVETFITSASAVLDSNPLDNVSEAIDTSRSNSQDTKGKEIMSNSEPPIFQTVGMPSKGKNDLEIVAYMESSMGKILSSARPTVSTVSLVTSPRILLSGRSKMHTTEINSKPSTVTGVELDGINQDTDLEIMKNSVEVEDHLPNLESNALSPHQTETVEPYVTIRARRVDNNLIDDDLVPWNKQESQSLVSEKYLASYRTTQSYYTLQQHYNILTSPRSNDVLSAYVEDLVESALDNVDTAQKKRQNTKETSWKEDENMVTANSGAFYYTKLTTEADISMASKTPVVSSGNTRWVLMPTKVPRQDQSTWFTSFTKGNPPDSLSTYLSREITLETRANTWTEKLFAHQLSTRKSISTAAKKVETTKDAPTAPNATVRANEKRRGATTRFLLDSTSKTPTADMQLSFLQPHEMATPSALTLSRDPVKMEQSDHMSAQPQKGNAGPVVTPKNVTSTSSLELFTPGTRKTPGTVELEPADRSTKPDAIPRQGTGTASPQISSSSTTNPKIPVTGRRGQIRVTTQRALQRPRLLEASSSTSFMEPSLAPPCIGTQGACQFLVSNKTLLQWNDLKRTLSFAWEMHVYGTAVLFLILAIIAFINVIGSSILHVFNLPYILASNALLVLVGLFRALFFFTDPYGTKSMLSHQTALVLYNITFPLILSTFAILVLLMLKMAQLQVLPSKIQSLPLLAVVGVIHFIVLFSTDLFSHFLNPSVNVVLHFLSASWGTFLMVGNCVAYYKFRRSSEEIMSQVQRESPGCDDTVDLQVLGRNLKCLFTSSRVLLVCSVFGLLCCGLQIYAVLWLFEILGKVNEFSWSWWFLQFWFRIFELVLCFAMLFVASHLFCQKCGSNDHTCWAKIVRYLCTYRKTEVPEYPNNCYDWANGHQDRSTNNDISKSLIRNPPESVALRALKDNNENKAPIAFYKSGSSSPLFKPRPGLVFGPKAQNVAMGRSHTSICFEKDSMLSLTDLEFRPPSPINLSRSIDEALFREHLVRDSIFLDSSLQYPSYLSRQDSCSSLKECSGLNQTIDPLISSDLKLRRNNNPDYIYSLARCSSLTDVNSPSVSLQQSKDLPNDITTEAAASGSSLDSFSKGSIKISWNPWRHGLSSVESLPLEDTPSTQLLTQACTTTTHAEAKDLKKESAKSLIKLSQPVDSHSISSDTIEL